MVAPDEGTYFHNRLTHSLKVAQLSQRIADKLQRSHPGVKLDNGEPAVIPTVAEAAALAHDLGHPPFGHVGETELNRLVKDDPGEAGSGGFEGNAQSFRILTRLEPHSKEFAGLDLTRRTLNAVLKYPWLRKDTPDQYKARNKFGAYTSDQEDFRFARKGWEVTIDPDERLILAFLQRLVWVYVIDTPRVGPRQQGYALVVRKLHEFFVEAIRGGASEGKLIPAEFRSLMAEAAATGSLAVSRLAADIVASMSDPVALQRYREIRGHHTGSVTDTPLLQ